jgi:hypothetical protein
LRREFLYAFAGIHVTAEQVASRVDGNQLPPPPPKFGGVIKESAKDSKPWWTPRVVPPKGAPNILLIMTDDQGFFTNGGSRHDISAIVHRRAGAMWREGGEFHGKSHRQSDRLSYS